MDLLKFVSTDCVNSKLKADSICLEKVHEGLIYVVGLRPMLYNVCTRVMFMQRQTQ